MPTYHTTASRSRSGPIRSERRSERYIGPEPTGTVTRLYDGADPIVVSGVGYDRGITVVETDRSYVPPPRLYADPIVVDDVYPLANARGKSTIDVRDDTYARFGRPSPRHTSPNRYTSPGRGFVSRIVDDDAAVVNYEDRIEVEVPRKSPRAGYSSQQPRYSKLSEGAPTFSGDWDRNAPSLDRGVRYTQGGYKKYAISEMKDMLREKDLEMEREHAQDEKTIAGLRNTISRLQQKVTLLEDERSNLVQGGTRAHDDTLALRKEVARLTRLLDDERATARKSDTWENKIKQQDDLIELQRRLLQMKDEEIRNLSQLAAAHKEQIAILYSQMNHKEIDEILDDNFDIKTIDLDTLAPESKQRILDLTRGKFGPGYEAHSTEKILVENIRTAYALDAADGVIDGKFKGVDIEASGTRTKEPYPKAGKAGKAGKSTGGDGDKVADLRRQLAKARKEREALGKNYK